LTRTVKPFIIEVHMPDLEKTAHWSIHLTGDAADEINLIELVKELGLKVEVTSGVCQIYYNPLKPKADTPKK
jgi:hypothetical protein